MASEYDKGKAKPQGGSNVKKAAGRYGNKSSKVTMPKASGGGKISGKQAY